MRVPPGETVLEARLCPVCTGNFAVTDEDARLLDALSPTFGGVREALPMPTLCPDCRRRRRMCWWNLHSIYRRTCSLTGESMLSMYPPETPFPVYEYRAWWGDGWDARDYGREPDFGRPVFEQIAELMREVPRFSKSVFRPENSEYTTNAGSIKNCYLVFNCNDAEDCYYGISVYDSRDCVDSLYIKRCERSYGCVECSDCYGCRECRECEGCSESYYLYACRDCHRCYGCANLVGKKYHIFNEPVPEDEYDARVRELLRGGHAHAVAADLPRRATVERNTSKSSGDHIFDCSGCHMGYQVREAEDVRYVEDVYATKSSMDVYSFGATSERLYEDAVVGIHASGVLFSADSWDSVANLLYCQICVQGCHDCFGCVGLKNASYCIFNKQYSKEEYEALVPRLIAHMRSTGEWGEFFPHSLSPFGYNETMAVEYFPLSREEALALGFNWCDYEAPFPKLAKVIPAAKLPASIADIPDDVLDWAIECEVTKKPYRIIRQELEFYRKNDIPLPRRHPDRRHLDRMASCNPRTLHERTCDRCGADMLATYAPGRPERVYCGACYDEEVSG